MAPKKEYKIDMFKDLLPALDRRDFKFYSGLADEQKKGFAGVVAMRYMSVVSDKNLDLCEYHIKMVNEAANRHFWNSEMQKHKELQYLTLAVAGIGKKQHHQWIKGPSTRKKKNKIMQLLSEFYPTANDDELQMFFDMNNEEDIIDIAKRLGYQDEQIKDLKKELKRLR